MSAAQEECISRKKFFNMMEDMKGKIRVYARVRPMLSFESDRGHKNALNIPDELTLDHIWKDKKREYNFDAVFAPDASQDKVRDLLLKHQKCMPWEHNAIAEAFEDLEVPGQGPRYPLLGTIERSAQHAWTPHLHQHSGLLLRV